MTFDELLAFAGRHPMLSGALVLITLALVYTEVARLLRPFKGLRPAELTALVNREDALVVDVSAAADFERGHVAGSRSIPASGFGPDHRLLAGHKARHVVLVDRTGMTVAPLATRLKKAGFESVHVLEGGIAAWQQADLPLVKGRAR